MDWKDKDIENRPASEGIPEDELTADLRNISLETSLNYFSRYLSAEFFESAAYYTNLYAVQQETPCFKPANAVERSPFLKWQLSMTGSIK